jgi:D-alanyl-D-alanine carboxypeptidase
MYRAPVEASRGLRCRVWGIAAVLAPLMLASAPADARAPLQLTPARAASSIGNPRYAAIVVDANTGATLREANSDSLRYPASLTKIMTLYLLFERIEGGKLTLSTRLTVSEDAASQAPTKLGLRAGQTIAVEDAIKALITRSANDVAVVIAEALAGSEDEFAKLMTRRARALGMTRTVYRNASGLPDDEQVTTARDQARLGVAIQDRFPRFYRYFSIAHFTYHGNTMRNHNRLLGQIAGVDGIKTGYTSASGYNLVTSVRRGGRHMVAVVLGGNSGAQRDAHMRDLIDRHLVEASVKRPAVKVSQAPAAAAPRPEPSAESRPKPRIVIVPVVPSPSDTVAAIIPAPTSGSHDPINPTAVKTVPIRASTGPLFIPQITAFAPASEMAQRPAIEASPLPAPSETATAPDTQTAVVTITGNIGAPAVASAAASEPVTPPSRSAASAQGNWVIQIGAFEQEGEARQRLNIARNKAAELLGAAEPYTERTAKGDKTFYRARFAVFDRTQAEAVCKQLQRNDIACFALKI